MQKALAEVRAEAEQDELTTYVIFLSWVSTYCIRKYHVKCNPPGSAIQTDLESDLVCPRLRCECNFGLNAVR